MFLFPLISIGTLSSRASLDLNRSVVSQERRAHIQNSTDVVAVSAVRNLQDQNWLERLEVVAKNVSGRPIYFLQVLVVLPVVSTELDGVPRRLIVPLDYGRSSLTLDGHFATPYDRPIQPRETHVFKIPELNRRGIENRLAFVALQASMLIQILIRVEAVSFGDGTGFVAAGAAPLSFNKTTNSQTAAWQILDRDQRTGRRLRGVFAEGVSPLRRKPGSVAVPVSAPRKVRVGTGNGDGRISVQDAIFRSLRLWQDTNHNGISEASELHRLRALGLALIDLDYRESRRTDQYGNRFRYRAKVRDTGGAQLGRWAWDVFLVSQ